MLAEGTLRQLSGSVDDCFVFDLSKISAEQYEPLFRTLQRFGVREVETLGFSCSELARYEARGQTGSPLPSHVATSIAKTKSHHVRNVVELLCYLVEKSRRLSGIELTSLSFQIKHLERIGVAFSRSAGLRSISFSRVPMEDDGLRALLNGLDPDKIEFITIEKCGITGAITDDVIAFIKRRRGTGGISSFDVSAAEVPFADRRRIATALGKELRSPSPRKIVVSEDSEDVQSRADDTQDRITQLRRENRSLREQIRALTEMVNSVKIGDSVFVVGKGASEFVLYLSEVEQRLIDLDKSRRVYP